MLAGCGAPETAPSAPPAASTMPAGGAGADLSPTVTAPDGVTIHYDDQGEGELTLLFVHGWSCDRSYWNAQRDYFAQRYRVVTVDLAGHGESTDNRDEFTMEAFGADVAAVADALGLQEIVLVGHSMGGSVVLAAANQLGARVKAVVAVDTLRDITARPSKEQLEQNITQPDEEFAADIRGFVAGMFVEQSDPKLRDWVIEDMVAAPIRVARGAGYGMGIFDAEAAIKTLQAPLVLINSDYRPTQARADRGGHRPGRVHRDDRRWPLPDDGGSRDLQSPPRGSPSRPVCPSRRHDGPACGESSAMLSQRWRPVRG
jgi:pimeloyl-ACP methyl ester carboxylesterase